MSIDPLLDRSDADARRLDVDALITAYHDERPNPGIVAQRVSFGTSGHRGTSFERSFNAWHVLAITQAICRYRRRAGVTGPLFLGIDTHALSAPACATALEVLAANGVDVLLARDDDYVPTPALSHAIVGYNRGRHDAFADGIVMTPSHNPPEYGGYKYNPLTGGPADQDVTRWIEDEANRLLEDGLDGMRRMPLADALRCATTHRHDFRDAYVADLGGVVDLDVVRTSGLRLAVDPLGGAGVRYWPAIAERYRLDLTILRDTVDATFAFMPPDRDGKIRMDPSSSFAMRGLIARKDDFDLSFACDPDHDRHGIVTRGQGLLPPNHYLSVLVDYLFAHRPDWMASVGAARSVVTTRVVDRVCERAGRRAYEFPVGFKWFVPGLEDGQIGIACEESAGATCIRRDGGVWTTDKDGIVAALLAAEITATTGEDPGVRYAGLADAFGHPVADRRERAATREEMQGLAGLSPTRVGTTTFAGETIETVVNTARDNLRSIGGLAITTRSGWCVVRPSGTEPLYKIYAESFAGPDHLERMFVDAEHLVDDVLHPQAMAP